MNEAKQQCGMASEIFRAMAHPGRFAEPATVPDGTMRPPLAWETGERLPVLGPLVRMKSISLDPIGLIKRINARYGDMFTIRVPTTPDFTFLLHEDAYRLVLSLPAEHAAIGQVLDSMPTVGYWFPRAESGPDSLQELIVSGRRMMATLMPPARVGELAKLVPEVVERQTADWDGEVDLTTRFYPIVYEASLRYFIGDTLWNAIGPQLVRLYRDIVNGIEITHIALSQTAFKHFMPEYRATRRLHRLLRAELPRFRDEDSPLLQAIRTVRIGGEPLDDADTRWMFMYVLWNATVYPGSYSFWTLIDVLLRPDLVARVRDGDQDARRDLLARCLLENIRLNPVSSLIRYLRKPLEFEHEGRRYHIPGDQMVGVLPGVSNRRIPGRPDEFDPDRYLREDVPREGIFGRGAFGCPAPEFNKTLAATVLDEIMRRFDVTLAAGLPERRCRVPEIYPSGPTLVRATRREHVQEMPPVLPSKSVAVCPFASTASVGVDE